MNWNNVSIKKGRELEELYNDPFYQDNGVERLIQEICILCDMTPDEVESIPFTEFKGLKDKVQFLYEQPDANFKRVININGDDYHFIDISSSKFSVGEFADLDTYCKSPSDKLEDIMAVLFRKKDEPYEIEIIQERVKLFRDNFPYQDAVGASLFFSLFVMDSIKPTKEYSMLEMMMMNWMKEISLLKEQLVVVEQTQKKQQESNLNGL